MDRILKEVIKQLSSIRIAELAYVLSGHHNNRRVAKRFKLTLWQVVVLNNNIPELCHVVIKQLMVHSVTKKRAAKIYKFIPLRRAV
jgi:hypothetical protein